MRRSPAWEGAGQALETEPVDGRPLRGSAGSLKRPRPPCQGSPHWARRGLDLPLGGADRTWGRSGSDGGDSQQFRGHDMLSTAVLGVGGGGSGALTAGLGFFLGRQVHGGAHIGEWGAGGHLHPAGPPHSFIQHALTNSLPSATRAGPWPTRAASRRGLRWGSARSLGAGRAGGRDRTGVGRPGDGGEAGALC